MPRDLIEEMALIRMSQLQRELYFGWIAALEKANQHEEADALLMLAARAETERQAA